MITRLISFALVFGLAATAHASVWFSSIPSTKQSGVGYYVEASASGGSYTLTIYKNGGYFAGGGSSPIGGSTTDYGVQTVNYQAELYDWYTMDYDYAYASVSITPANAAPTISWTQAPSSAQVNQTFTIEAKGEDSNGNLTNVKIWRDESPFAFAGGGTGSVGYSSNTYNQSTAGTVTFKAEALDSNGASSGYIYHYVSIYNNAPTIQWLTFPTYNSSTGNYEVYVNQYFIVQARGNDANGNLSSVSVWKNDSPFAFNGGGSGSQGDSDANGATGTTPGTISFKALAGDSAGANSGYIYRNVTVVNRAPATPSITPSGTGVTNDGGGQYHIYNEPPNNQITVSSTMTDADGNLANHTIYYQQVTGASPDPGSWIALTSGTPSGGSSSTVSTTQTMLTPGRWDFHVNGHDGYLGTGGASFTLYVYGLTNNSTFVSQVINGQSNPTSLSLNTGQTVSATVTMKNTGTKPWNGDATPHKLSSQTPTDNTNWSLNRVTLPTSTINPPPQSGDTAAFTFNITAPTTPGAYTFQWRMIEEGFGLFGASSTAVTVTVNDTIAPTTPSSLQSPSKTHNSVNLSWTASTDNSGSVTYAIYRNGGGSPIGTSATTSFTDTGRSPNTTYSYTVKAYDAASNYSAASNSINVTTNVDPYADDDADGIPNVWESANGLNPNSAGDGQLDPDGDGLTNVAEYNLGKNPQSYNAGTSTLGGTIPGGWPNTAGSSTYAVGMTAGSLGVDKNGAANYSIPLWVVPGTSGMQPQLALNYSSQAGSSWLGFGWSLSGLSAITRGPQTKATDDNITGISFTTSDRFYLDGQRLIAISGTYGANGTEYRTELDSISRIISYNTAGTGPASFKVWTKAGLLIEFGNTTDSAAEAQGRSDILTWAVNSISDTKGNAMDFVYTENTTTGEHRIDRINYTRNTGASLTAYASVRFTYENRTDTFNGYISGSKVARSQRIKTIAAYYGETKVREYTLDYTERTNTGRSLLTTLHEKAPADSREYPPMTFEYDEAETGWTSLGSAWNLPVLIGEHQQTNAKGTGFVDLNGDGRPDFVQYRVSNTGTNLGRGAWLNTVNGWQAADGTSGSVDYRLPVPLAKDGSTSSSVRFVDVNNDGLVDVTNGEKVYLNTPGTGFVESATWAFPRPALSSTMRSDFEEAIREHMGWAHGTTVTIDDNSYYYSGSLGSFQDVDGDGRPDFVGYMGTYVLNHSSDPAFSYSKTEADGWRNTGSGWERASNYGGVSDRAQGFRFMDVNADGRLDIVRKWSGNSTITGEAYLGTGTGWSIQGTSSPFIPPLTLNAGTVGNDNAPFGTEAADVNGDGLIDLIQNNNYGTNDARLGTGTGWTSSESAFYAPFNLSDNNTPLGVALMDINSDGLVDIVKGWYGSQEVRLGTGRGWSSNVSAYNLPRHTASTGHPTTGSDLIDLDADGAVDQIWSWLEAGVTANGAALNKSKPADRLKKITNGFGVAAQLAYAPLTERDGSGNFTVYDKGTGGPTGTMNVIGPMYVVKTVSNDDGAGGQYAVNYRYGGLRADRLRGSLGFEWTQATDSRTSIVSKTTYKQEYPYIGMVATTETKSGSTVLSSSSITYADKNTTGAVRLPYASVVTQTSNDLNGAAISSSTTTTQIDTYGNVTSMVVDTGGGYTKTTTNSYTADNTSLWLLGRLTGSSVASAATGKSTLTRASSFTYHGTTGLLETETVEPGDNTLKLTTTYGYDAFGNKTSVSVAGLAITVDSSGNVSTGSSVSRTSVTAYDSKGRFPISSTNALGHTETYDDYDQGLGVLKSLTGANSLTTTWTYDSFGVKTRETRADTTVTDYRLRWAGSGAPAGSHTQVEIESTGSVPSLVFNDSFGRPLWGLGINGDGAIVYQKTAYDSMGRAYAKSNPYYNDGSTIYWTQTASYDALNRPLSVQTPDDTSSYVTTSYSYNGRETSVTDPLGRVARSTVNTQGWLIEAVRNNAGGANDRAVVTHDYDALGNLTSTVAAGVTTTLAYDLRGRKTSMVDPDMGTWLYRYNIFGELIWQKDAKGQVSTLAYDALGRLTSRVETEGTTTWTYDTSATKGVGKLHTVSAPGSYSETYTYDSYGRPSALARVIDGSTYSTSQTYDSASRLQNTVYPTGFQTRNYYNAFGYLKEVRRADSGRTDVYWMADHYAVTGQIDGEVYGNGLVNDRVFSVKTGRLTGAAVGKGFESSSPYSVQYLTYARDAMGNVTGRNDTAPGVGRSEVFVYDGLDRLTSQTVNSGTAVTVGYDAKGNITSKSDVGTYAYAGTGPHALSGVSGGTLGTQTYAYDANGNMTGGGGRTITWKSFNQVASITKGSYSSTFSFGANHERVKQVSHLGTTIYVGSLYEKVTNGAAFEHKHYIFAPTGRIAVYAERSDLSKDLRYFHTDGLGSITAVSNELGTVLKRFAFDAWGKRIDPGTSSVITGTTAAGFNRGFTDHEQLDDLGLVHMNGRVYDPVLGRFLSADPFVGDVGDSQEYNRYSYLTNNPLGGTDPSGFFSLKDVVKIVAVVALAWAGAGFAIYAVGAGSGATVAGSFAALAGNGATLTLAGAVSAGAGAGFASGFAGSLLNGGSIGDAFKAGVVGGIVGGIGGGLAHGIGTLFEGVTGFEGWSGRALSHGLVQGGAAELQGGQFRHGFYVGFATAGASPGIGLLPKQARWIGAAVVGGTASALGGGKFANGAVSGAFQYLLNDSQHGKRSTREAIVINKNTDAYKRLRADAEAQLEAAPNSVIFEVTNFEDGIRQVEAEAAAGGKFDRVFFSDHSNQNGAYFDSSILYIVHQPAVMTALANSLTPRGTIWLDGCLTGMHANKGMASPSGWPAKDLAVATGHAVIATRGLTKLNAWSFGPYIHGADFFKRAQLKDFYRYNP